MYLLSGRMCVKDYKINYLEAVGFTMLKRRGVRTNFSFYHCIWSQGFYLFIFIKGFWENKQTNKTK